MRGWSSTPNEFAHRHRATALRAGANGRDSRSQSRPRRASQRGARSSRTIRDAVYACHQPIPVRISPSTAPRCRVRPYGTWPRVRDRCHRRRYARPLRCGLRRRFSERRREQPGRDLRLQKARLPRTLPLLGSARGSQIEVQRFGSALPYRRLPTAHCPLPPYARNTVTAFWPPKPKPFAIAVFTVIERAVSGT